jgi:hypothetical protein
LWPGESQVLVFDAGLDGAVDASVDAGVGGAGDQLLRILGVGRNRRGKQLQAQNSFLIAGPPHDYCSGAAKV